MIDRGPVSDAIYVGAVVRISGVRGIVGGTQGTVRAVRGDWLDVSTGHELVCVHRRNVRRVQPRVEAGDPADGASA